jgi:hypothetical protein
MYFLMLMLAVKAVATDTGLPGGPININNGLSLVEGGSFLAEPIITPFGESYSPIYSSPCVSYVVPDSFGIFIFAPDHPDIHLTPVSSHVYSS